MEKTVGEVMSLREAVLWAAQAPENEIENEDEETSRTLYAARIEGEWTPDSPAVAVWEAFDETSETRPQRLSADYERFLEVGVLQEVRDGYRIMKKRDLTDEEFLRGVIYYAENDCPLDL